MSKYPEALAEIENNINSHVIKVRQLKNIIKDDYQPKIDSMSKEIADLEQLISRFNAAKQLLLDNDEKETENAP